MTNAIAGYNQKSIHNIEYTPNKVILKDFYNKEGIGISFEHDNNYIEKAFQEINKLWQENFKQIKTVNFLMIAEAPLWGKRKRYIYNPDVNNSQFFYRNDLGDILNRDIKDKKKFIQVCNEIGLLIVDISPFPLNKTDTTINYRGISTANYSELVSLTIPKYFAKKIEAVLSKKSESIQVFFRYARVKNNFEDIISKVLVDFNIISNNKDIGDISQQGGGIDRIRLGKILSTNIKLEN